MALQGSDEHILPHCRRTNHCRLPAKRLRYLQRIRADPQHPAGSPSDSPPSKSHPAKGRLVKLTDMVEKPAVEKAPSQLAVLGRYVLTPEIFELLETQGKGAGGEIQLTDAIKRLLDRQAVYAYDFEGKRYDVGDKFGFIKATIDFALDREDLHDQVNEYIHTLVEKEKAK